jgi:NADH-quinone oxidoreductase subunit L
MENYFYLMPLFPLLGWLFLIAFGKRLPEPVPGYLATIAVMISFFLAIFGFIAMRAATEEKNFIPQVLWDFLPYIGGGGNNLKLGFELNPLSSLMTLIITGVGALIHLFSIGYMHGDKGFSRFFAYLNFFVGMMLILVLGDSLPVLFIGWEGVGVASFLLIGFWYTDFNNSNAARKAFVVNRIGDAFLMLGMFLLFQTFGTLNIHDILEPLSKVVNVPLVGTVSAAPISYGSASLELACVFLLLGAAGKSAQLPLSTWLPDAMAGPTPVSALIHAATMVTAGVYLVARFSGLFSNAPVASSWVAWIGAMTAVYGALSALAQTDIKKILAYSTISQLGYMFIAVGSGAYWAGIFHVLTHAFFKALLFLSSGSVIHAVDGEQDVRKMGGLAKKMPLTHVVSLIGTLAIAGVPLLSGFFSKDAILESAFRSPFAGGEVGGYLLWGTGVLVAALTAGYMWRWYMLVFQGAYRGDAHPHESPSTMTTPLVVLAAFSILAGYIGLPHVLGKNANLLEPFLEKISPNAANFLEISPLLEWGLILVSILASLAGIATAHYFYTRKGARDVAEMPTSLGEASRNALYLDRGYDLTLANPARFLSQGLEAMDEGGLRTGINLAGEQVAEAGSSLSVWQSGYVRSYGIGIFLGTAALLAYLIVQLLRGAL